MTGLPTYTDVPLTVLCPFGGLGGGALGFLDAEVRLLGIRATYHCVGGIDMDPHAAKDFANLTGCASLCADVRDITPAQLRELAGNKAPNVVFLSPPCKGASGLLSATKAKTAKYRAMNKLSLVWMKLMLDTWEEPPDFVLLENVPRLKKRAARMLRLVRSMLSKRGYHFTDGYHDCGEIGGLAQKRRRYLMMARHNRVAPFLYQPVKKRVRACGDVLETLPMPTTSEAAEYGRIHELPKLSWLNWVRLSLIPAGGDWRDLPGVLAEEQERREVHRRHHVEDWSDPSVTIAGSGSNGPSGVADPRGPEWYRGTLGVMGFEEPAGTVTGNARPSTGNFSVADPRVVGLPSCGPEAFHNNYRVEEWDEPARTVTGATRPGGGAPSVGDPRVIPQANNPNMHHGKYEVRDWSEPAPTVTGAGRVGSGAASVADPRAFKGAYGVRPWEEPSGAICGETSPTNGTFAVADPRAVGLPTVGPAIADPRVATAFDHGYRVLGWQEPSFTVAGGSHPGQGAYSVADVRVDCQPRAGAYGVLSWQEAAKTVTGAGSVDNGTWAVADPRAPEAPPLMVIRDVTKPPPSVPIIIAKDGTWHRPLTTLELAALQSLPTRMRDGSPLKLSGKSQSGWRERIGNAVPPKAARAIAEQIAVTLVNSMLGKVTLSGDLDVWVDGEVEQWRGVPMGDA